MSLELILGVERRALRAGDAFVWHNVLHAVDGSDGVHFLGLSLADGLAVVLVSVELLQMEGKSQVCALAQLVRDQARPVSEGAMDLLRLGLGALRLESWLSLSERLSAFASFLIFFAAASFFAGIEPRAVQQRHMRRGRNGHHVKFSLSSRLSWVSRDATQSTSATRTLGIFS